MLERARGKGELTVSAVLSADTNAADRTSIDNEASASISWRKRVSKSTSAACSIPHAAAAAVTGANPMSMLALAHELTQVLSLGLTSGTCD